MMETRDDAVVRTFCSQTKLIVDLAVESAASVLLRFEPEGTGSEDRQVRRKVPCLHYYKTGWFADECSQADWSNW